MLFGFPAAVIAVLYGFYDGRGRLANFIAFTLVLLEGAFVASRISGQPAIVLTAAVVIFLAVGYHQHRRARSPARPQVTKMQSE